MSSINTVSLQSSNEVGGVPACFIACGVFCYGTGGAGTVVASAAYLL